MPLPQGEYVEGSGTLDDPLVLAGYMELDVWEVIHFTVPFEHNHVGDEYAPRPERIACGSPMYSSRGA